MDEGLASAASAAAANAVVLFADGIAPVDLPSSAGVADEASIPDLQFQTIYHPEQMPRFHFVLVGLRPPYYSAGVAGIHHATHQYPCLVQADQENLCSETATMLIR